MGGYLGWKLFEWMVDKQMMIFQNDLQICCFSDYFVEKMLVVKQVDEFVLDYCLLQVVFCVFGLDNDIVNKVFIIKVFEVDFLDSDSFVNWLFDKCYFSLNKVLGMIVIGGGMVGNMLDNVQVVLDIDVIFDFYVMWFFEKNIGECY